MFSFFSVYVSLSLSLFNGWDAALYFHEKLIVFSNILFKLQNLTEYRPLFSAHFLFLVFFFFFFFFKVCLSSSRISLVSGENVFPGKKNVKLKERKWICLDSIGYVFQLWIWNIVVVYVWVMDLFLNSTIFALIFWGIIIFLCFGSWSSSLWFLPLNWILWFDGFSLCYVGILLPFWRNYCVWSFEFVLGFVEMIEVIFAFMLNYVVVRENASVWISFLSKLRCLQCVYNFLKNLFFGLGGYTIQSVRCLFLLVVCIIIYL